MAEDLSFRVSPLRPDQRPAVWSLDLVTPFESGASVFLRVDQLELLLTTLQSWYAQHVLPALADQLLGPAVTVVEPEELAEDYNPDNFLEEI